MANLFSSSIGRKLIMSISGLFLITFLLVHLTLNLFLILDAPFGFEEGQMFNAGAHFMATNPLIKVMEPVLAIGLIVHIIYSLILSVQNMRARGSEKYASGKKTKGVEWSSNNMLVLGFVVFAFLVLHLANFWVKMKFIGDPSLLPEVSFPFFGSEAEGHNAYALVNETFQHLWIVVVYIIANIALGLHLSHGFWSGFQTIGLNNNVWMNRLKVTSVVLSFIIAGGFSVIALVQYLYF